MKQMSAFFVTSFVLVLLSGCSNIPKQISTAPSNDLQLNEIQGQIENFANQDVRWGGELVSVENNNDVLEVSSMYKWHLYQPIQRDPFYDPFFYNGFYPYNGYYNRYWQYQRFGYPYYYW